MSAHSQNNLAEVREIPILIPIAGPHDYCWKALLAIQLGHVVPHRGAHITAQLPSSKGGALNAHRSVDELLQPCVLLRLVDNDFDGTSGFDVFAATVKGPCAAVDGLAHAHIIDNGAAVHLLRPAAEGQYTGRVNTAGNGRHARLEPEPQHVVVKFAALGVDP